MEDKRAMHDLYHESADDEPCWTCDENYSNWESEK